MRVGACNPDSTDPRVVDYLARHGVEVFDGRREPRHIYDDTLRRFAAGPLDAICDMGGELIEAATLAGTSVAGARATGLGGFGIRVRAGDIEARPAIRLPRAWARGSLRGNPVSKQ